MSSCDQVQVIRGKGGCNKDMHDKVDLSQANRTKWVGRTAMC